MELNLLEKTEIWINRVSLDGANLGEIAAAVAAVLGLDPGRVLVIDVREDHIALDVLQRTVRAEAIAGKEKELLAALARLKGVSLAPGASVHSEGILGLISMEPEGAREALERSAWMGAEIRSRIARRAKVYPTGFEVLRGMIQDTNSPFLAAELEQLGYRVSIGSPIEDNPYSVAEAVRRACSEGFGLVITTGGVGAEDKDHSTEGLLLVDPEAAVESIMTFEKGVGRHAKEGVRIAVGVAGACTMVALPGPNDEVRAAFPALVEALRSELPKEGIARSVGRVLRQRLREKLAPGWSAVQAGRHHCGNNSEEDDQWNKGS